MLTCMCAKNLLPRPVLAGSSPCQVQSLPGSDPEFRMVYECRGERMFATTVFPATRTYCVFIIIVLHRFLNSNIGMFKVGWALAKACAIPVVSAGVQRDGTLSNLI